jgi:aspartate kinase
MTSRQAQASDPVPLATGPAGSGLPAAVGVCHAVAVGSVVVEKYGGSSLANLDSINRVAERVAAGHLAHDRRVLVVSAQGNTTDELLSVVTEIGGDRASREADQLLATGECASAALMAMALARSGVTAVSLTGAQAGIRAAGKHGEGVITSVDARRIQHLLAAGLTVVVAGFQGVTEDGDLITLGRGGSDTTAVALAAVLGASRCEIYTDVEGVCTADPRIVPTARVMASVPVGMMAEMAFAGARVLHSRAVELAAMHAVDVRVGNASSHVCGTTLTPAYCDSLEDQRAVTAVAHDADVARVLVRSVDGRDVAATVLGVLASHSVPVDLVARSGPHEAEFRMGFTVRRSDLGDVRGPLERCIGDTEGMLHVDDNVGKLSLIGMGLLNRPAYTARMLAKLSDARIPTSWISTSQLRTSAVVPLDRLGEAVQLLHREFRLDSPTLQGSQDDSLSGRQADSGPDHEDRELKEMR